MLIVLIVGMAGIVGIVVSVISAQSSDETPEDAQMISSIESIETKPPTHTPTTDYCWFLTPTPELIPTIYVTPDTIQLQATQHALATGTPVPTGLPTQQPPYAWCNLTAEPTIATVSETRAP